VAVVPCADTNAGAPRANAAIASHAGHHRVARPVIGASFAAARRLLAQTF
jgi:hypothetical protein